MAIAALANRIWKANSIWNKRRFRLKRFREKGFLVNVEGEIVNDAIDGMGCFISLTKVFEKSKDKQTKIVRSDIKIVRNSIK